MKKGAFRRLAILLVILGFTLLSGGCSDFDEMKSQRLLTRAQTLLEQGDDEQAGQVLNELVTRYPDTQAAETAGKYLDRLQKQREMREYELFAPVIESYRMVLGGYHALYSEYPRSLADLDTKGYLFDSSYLDEVTPDGTLVYLWLKNDGSGYRLWCVADDHERGYAAEERSRRPTSFVRAEVEEKIRSRFRLVAWSRKLIDLQAL